MLVVALGGVSGCSLIPGQDEEQEPSSPVSSVSAPPDVVAALGDALAGRAAAVLHGDEQAFLSGLARGERRLRREQSTYFANLRQLPLGVFRYSFDPADLLREGDDYWVVVELRMELEGYDARPVATRDRFRFSPAGSGDRFLLASVSDLRWEVEHQVPQQPWDSGPITVRSVPGVLGVFDEDSMSAADALLRSVQQGIVYVAAVVPYEWSRSVVVYALSDSEFLDSIPDLPGNDPEILDGVAFPVQAGPDTDRIAATRFVLSPRMLDRHGPARDRLVRHELTHVAVGEHDDTAPVWLSEGLAEYVSVRPMAPEDRDISERAVAAARAGFEDLPADEAFNGADSVVHYAESWWACEYLASSVGEPTLWLLLDELAREEADQRQVLITYTGLNSRQIARKAGKLLLATYDPDALEPPSPEPSPTESPTASPTGSAPGDQPTGASPTESPIQSPSASRR